MIVSWNWLKEYVKLDMSVEKLTDRLLMSGLNLEEFSDVEGDIAIDLEVTSNRPDCLGHLGVAREVSVLFGHPLQIPAARITESNIAASEWAKVEIRCPDLCPRYTARVIRGVKIGPSPDWLRRRLTTVGLRPINNVVDATNYVLLECGQPLHAFDFDKLKGGQIVVRNPLPGEKITAIDQREYALHESMCVIADADRPVAVAGVMGGLDTEISDSSVNVLLEVADFAPRTVRSTARMLNLHSPSSYRFERGIDQEQMDWASRRCAEIILATAGGELLEGVVTAGDMTPPVRPAVTLRLSQLPRLLGIEISRTDVIRILTALGLTEDSASTAEAVSFVPPSWRKDLTREIDLIEETARIYGYERIPEDVSVPLAVSTPTIRDRVRNRVAEVLVGCGYFESVTLSFVEEDLFELFRPAGSLPALRVDHSSRRLENILRQSLLPSLLVSRRENERQGSFDARLFEMSRVYLAASPEKPEGEPIMLGMVTEQSFSETKGIIETIALAHNREAVVTVNPADRPEFIPGRGCEVQINGRPWGWLGEVAPETREKLGLREGVTVAELKISILEELIDLAPSYRELPQFPASERDLNFVLDEAVTWHELAEVTRDAAGGLLESLAFGGQYRGPQIPADKKSYIITLHYRAPDRTLTNDEIDATQQAVIRACTERLGAVLR